MLSPRAAQVPSQMSMAMSVAVPFSSVMSTWASAPELNENHTSPLWSSHDGSGPSMVAPTVLPSVNTQLLPTVRLMASAQASLSVLVRQALLISSKASWQRSSHSLKQHQSSSAITIAYAVISLSTQAGGAAMQAPSQAFRISSQATWQRSSHSLKHHHAPSAIPIASAAIHHALPVEAAMSVVVRQALLISSKASWQISSHSLKQHQSSSRITVM